MKEEKKGEKKQASKRKKKKRWPCYSAIPADQSGKPWF